MANKKATSRRKSNASVPVIGTLVNILAGPAKAKDGMTVPQLVSALEKKTGRKPESLTFTVRAQLSRLPNERKGVKIRKVRDGQNMRYFADVKKAA